MHFWPILSHNTVDLVGSKNLYNSNNATFSRDRFGNINSSLSFNHGYIQAPDGVYFENEFTFLAWVKLRSYRNWQRLFDFGNKNRTNNILVSLSELSHMVFFRIRDHGSTQINTTILQLDKWYHLAFTFKNGKMITYINSLLYKSKTIEDFNINLNVPRNICYFGKSTFLTDQSGDYQLDDVKIFNKELKDSDIESEFINGYF